jgi:uncharacterized protein YfeS
MTTKHLYFIVMTISLLISSCQGQTNKPATVNSTSPTYAKDSSKTQVDNFELTPETANPKAKQLMTETFYWDITDEFGPFGSDDGSDAFYGFREWRLKNPNVSPTVYLKKLNDEWGYESTKAVIAIGFGQFVLEGRIDTDLQELTKEALNKRFAPSVLDGLNSEYPKFRTERLTKMTAVLDKMNK